MAWIVGRRIAASRHHVSNVSNMNILLQPRVCALMRLLSVLASILWLSIPAWGAATNLVFNGSFEDGVKGWSTLWTRQADAGSANLDHFGVTNALKVVHTGSQDWSVEWLQRIPVKPGEIYDLGANARLDGQGSVTVCVSSWDVQGRNLGWSDGSRTLQHTTNWTYLGSRFVVPQGVAQIQARFIGHGKSTVWMTHYKLVQSSSVASLRKEAVPAQLAISNQFLTVVFETSNATFAVTDKRTGRTWSQVATHADLVVLGAQQTGSRIGSSLMDVPSGLNLDAVIELESGKPEITFELSGQGALAGSMHFPHPFSSQAGDRLIIPMNEGISYPVDDATIEPFSLIAYGGHGICMAFWGVTDGNQGHSAIFETPDDASIQGRRQNKLLAVSPVWDPQKGQLGYARRLRYVFFDQGGHVAIAKRYREYAKAHGFFKTLADKRKENSNVDLLVGAVNVWNWDADPVAMAKELQAAGIERILWSRGGSPDALRELNEMKVLTSRYDIYQDVMDPANFPKLSWLHPDWTTPAWPDDIIKSANGDWLRGWGIQARNGEWFACGVTCDKRAVDYARKRVPDDLATHPYKCRFIDTTTAAPWNECYDSRHPMTRSESREWKMKLLDYMSRDAKQVTGCETGHDASVPFLHYFEGMLSLGPYRVPDAGRDMQRIWTEVPEQVAKFQLGQRYRLPLWELVFHDCVVAQWYWGDYNNKLPSLWAKRDLFNLLYGTPPMFMFNRELWRAEKDRFVQSYKNICPTVRKIGYCEMTNHRFLTADRDVQQSVFANGTVVTVNFGSAACQLSSGETVPPLGFVVKD